MSCPIAAARDGQERSISAFALNQSHAASNGGRRDRKLPVDTAADYAIIAVCPEFADAHEVQAMRSQIRGANYLSWFVALAVVGLHTRAAAQTPPDPASFRNGVDYTFEREVATRDVRDTYDRGTISLVANVWRPTA